MKLLVPTDFSPNAETAIKYAIELAGYLDGSIHLVHVINPLAGNSFLTPDSTEIRSNVVFDLHARMEKINKIYGIKTSCDVSVGVVADEIIKLSQERRADVIIMGTQGMSGVTKILFGSNTSAVINDSTIPVFALPHNTSFNPPRRIVFATDYSSGDIEDIKQVASFARKFNAEIIAVHIVDRFKEEDDDIASNLPVIRYFDEVVKNKIAYDRIRCEEYQHIDVAEGIQCYVEEEHADILALSRRHRGFVEKLFHKSLACDYALDIPVPLLIFESRPDHESNNDF